MSTEAFAPNKSLLKKDGTPKRKANGDPLQQ
jgi:hypothetical protein